MNTQPDALRLADELEMWTMGEPAAAELRRLHAENEKLRSVMVAAAEEIHEHWDAHCDAEGYGPANLMHRLESGIPAEYRYKAGDFARLAAVNHELLEALRSLISATEGVSINDYNEEAHDIAVSNARAALAKVGVPHE
jgi:hypothetical protein